MSALFTPLQVTLYDIYLELMPASCTNLSNENVGKRRSPDSDEEFEGESYSVGVGLQGSLRRNRRSLRSGEGSISEAQVLSQQEKDGQVRRGQIQPAAAVEDKMSLVQVHNKDEKETAGVGDVVAKGGTGNPDYFETSL